MNEKNLVEKAIDKFKNNRIISIFILAGVVVTSIIGVFTSIKSVIPFSGEADKFCIEVESQVTTLLNEINSLEKDEISYSEVFRLNRLLQTFVILQQDDLKKKCQVVQQIEDKNRVVKDKVMTMIFKQVELWNQVENQGQQTSRIQSIIKSMCESLYEFMIKTDQHDKKEIEAIKNTIKLCQE